MALAAIAIPALLVVGAVYWLRQALVYDVLFLVTRQYAIRRIIRTITQGDIDDLVDIRFGYSHYWVTCGGLQELCVSVHVSMHDMVGRKVTHVAGVWPEVLYRIDRLVFNRNRSGSETYRAIGRALDLGDMVILLLNRYILPADGTI